MPRTKSETATSVIDRPLLPSEYGRAGPPSPSSRPTGTERSAEDNSRPQAEPGAKNIFSTIWARPTQEQVTFTGEPPRTSLLEPPPGYRTPSPSQPYGIGIAKPKAADLSDRSLPAR